MKFYKPKGLSEKEQKNFGSMCNENYQFVGNPNTPLVYLTESAIKNNEILSHNGVGAIIAQTKNTLIIATAAHCISSNSDKLFVFSKVFVNQSLLGKLLKELILGDKTQEGVFEKNVKKQKFSYLTSYKSKNVNEDLGFVVVSKPLGHLIKPFQLAPLSDKEKTLAFAVRHIPTQEGKINLRSGLLFGEREWRTSTILLGNGQHQAEYSSKKRLNSIPYIKGDFQGNYNDYVRKEGLGGQSGSPLFLGEKCFGICTNSRITSKNLTEILLLPADYVQERLEKIIPLVEKRFG